MINISCLLAGIMAIIPIVPAYVITIPHIIYLYFKSNYVYCILLFIVYFYVSGRVIDDTYKHKVDAHPYLIGNL